MNQSVNSSTLVSSLNAHLQHVQLLLYFVGDIINIVLGLPINVYILWLIVTGPREKMASHFFALNLAVSEIFSIMSNLMFIINTYKTSAVLYYFSYFFKGLFLYGRPPFQGCICVERYLAVVHPVTFLKYKPLRYRVRCSAVVWLLVIGSCCGYMLFESSLTWRCYAFIFNFILFSAMLFCCLAVLKALKRSAPGDGDREQEGTNNMKQRAFRIIFTILFFSGVMYLPRVLLLLSYHFIDPVEYSFGMSICFLNIVIFGFIQPVLFVHRTGKLPSIR